MGAEPIAYLRQPDEAELRWLGGTSTYFLATGEQTGEAFALVDERSTRGESVPLHLHRDDMESFYVLEGEITLYIDGRPGPGGRRLVCAHPRRHRPWFRVESETARYLILTTPRHGSFYRAITLAARPDGSPPLESIDGSRIRQACEEYGVEFAGPLPDAS